MNQLHWIKKQTCLEKENFLPLPFLSSKSLMYRERKRLFFPSMREAGVIGQPETLVRRKQNTPLSIKQWYKLKQ